MSERLSLRTRLALLYGGGVLLVGTTLLALTYVLLFAMTGGQPATLEPAGGPAAVSSADPAAPDPSAPATAQQGQDLKQQVGEAAGALRTEFREQTLPKVWRRLALVFAGLVPLAAWVGWWAAGKALRPVAEITASARRIASRNAWERISWQGPHDEVRELADTIDDLLARLEAAVDGQWRFVANASHELKTPLAINRTLLEVAMQRPGAPAELVQLGETLVEVNSRHDRLINGLLTLARSERAVTRPVPVDLTEVVERVLDIARPEAEDAGVCLRVQARTARLLGDRALLERLVLNLVQNAIRYNVPGGSVDVVSAGDAHAVELKVTNTGPDVSAHDVPALFEPFRRLNDRVGSASGSGLGLSIVSSVARAHGGTVLATPRHGGGLVVDVSLPAG